MPPPSPRKFLNLWNAISDVLTQQSLSKIFSNLITTFVYNPFGIKVLGFICYFLQFLEFFGKSELSILHFIFFYENLMKMSQHNLKSRFFQSQSHIGQDLGSSKIGIIPTKSGRLDSLIKLNIHSKTSTLEWTVKFLMQSQLGNCLTSPPSGKYH